MVSVPPVRPMVTVPELAPVPMLVGPVPVVLTFRLPVFPPLMVVTLAPLVLPSSTVFAAAPVPMSIVCAAEPPIVTVPVVVPVPTPVVNVDPLSLIVVFPSVFSVPSTVVVVDAPPIASELAAAPVLMFVGWPLATFRFSPPEPPLIVVVLVPLLLPSDTVLLAAPVPMSIVCAAEPPMVTAPVLVPVLIPVVLLIPSLIVVAPPNEIAPPLLTIMRVVPFVAMRRSFELDVPSQLPTGAAFSAPLLLVMILPVNAQP